VIKWELKERHDKQGEKCGAIIERYHQAVIAAGTHLADLKAEHEAILRSEFHTGKEKSADKASIRDRITEAERAVYAAQTELDKAQEFARADGDVDRIGVRDLVVDWNGAYRRQIRDVELQPIVERMRSAKQEYYNAVLEFWELRDRYSEAHRVIRELNYDAKYPGDDLYVHEITTGSDLPQINETDLFDIEKRRQLPSGIERVPMNTKGAA
jgi:hypothetical protein